MAPRGPANRESQFVRYARAGALAFEFIGTIAAGVFIGYQLDGYLATSPWFVLIMTLAGTAVGFYRMVQVLLRFERKS